MKTWFDAHGQAGKMLPIVSTEWGYSQCDLPNGAAVTETQQSQYVTRIWLMHAMEGVPISIWFQWQRGDNPEDVWSHFGLKRNDGSPRPALQAAEVLCKTLAGFRFVRRLDLKSDGVFALVFERRRLQVIAIWTIGEDVEVNVSTSGLVWNLRSMTGEEKKDVAKDQNTSVVAERSPKYLISVAAAGE